MVIKRLGIIALAALIANHAHAGNGTSVCTKRGTYNKAILALIRTEASPPAEFFTTQDMPRLGQLVAYEHGPGKAYRYGVVNKIEPNGFIEIITKLVNHSCRQPFRNGYSARGIPIESNQIGKIAPEQNIFMEIQDDETDASSAEVGSADES